MLKEEKHQAIKQATAILNENSAIENVGESEGGKILLRNLAIDIISFIEALSQKHTTMTMQEFIAIGAGIKSKMELIGEIRNSKRNKKYNKQELEKLLLEDIE
jgi:hypothetical protein